LQVLVLNGVNLDTLDRRDPTIYGGISLGELETRIYAWANELGLNARCRQSNSEGEYNGWIHDAHSEADGVVVNPGAWTHYSYAIHDALEMIAAPVAEVHLSAIEDREPWRRHSVIADLAAVRVSGKGAAGYLEAVDRLAALVGETREDG
jgi:3-dehydroquinate dehydratase-2